MSIRIQLLGRPTIEDASGGEVYRFRSRKTWALLTYLFLNERPPTRAQLTALLYANADDPLRTLRWGLTEIRRALGDHGSVEGDPVVLSLAAGSLVDVKALAGSWRDAARLPSLGAELLDGMTIQGVPAFESWLLSEQRHVEAMSEAVLHEAALGSLAENKIVIAIGYAVRAAMINPLDENHHALLIRLYRLAGDNAAADRQFATCANLLDLELGLEPGAATYAALKETRDRGEPLADRSSVAAIVEAGTAAVGAGAIDAGMHSLRTAVRLADGLGADPLRISSRQVLAGALIHAGRGFDEEGLAALFIVVDIATTVDDRLASAQARAELGYVDFLRARYDRSVRWLTEAIEFADGSPSIAAKATTYVGALESDRANYQRALELLTRAMHLARTAGEPRRESFALSMLGRVNLLRGELGVAAEQLDTSIEIAERDHWLAVLPWPQSLRGEVQLELDDPIGAAELLQQAFARACQLNDPCWEGLAARGLARVAEASGDPEHAFALLSDARQSCNRFADPYVWLDAYILDAQCRLGRRYDHPETKGWINTMRRLTSRSGMKELTVRALLHGAAAGNSGDRDAAVLLGTNIDNPELQRLLET